MASFSSVVDTWAALLAVTLLTVLALLGLLLYWFVSGIDHIG
jgi:hypothetical protein